MDRLQESVGRLRRRLLAWWREIPGGIRRILLFVAVAGLAPWLTLTSYDVANYALGADQILSGQSVYAPRVPSLTTGRLVPSYPYLPSFAMMLAVGIAPFFLLSESGILPDVAYEIVARQIANSTGYLALVGIPLLSYLVCSEAIRNDGYDDEVFWGVLVVALAPPLWFQVVESGSDTFVALLVLLGVYGVTRGRWLLAGLLVGTATFKFTALPLAAVLALYALSHGRKQFTAVAFGGILSQLPNLLYFAVFVEDFLFVVEQRGAMSLYSGETRGIATAPFRIAGLEQWYIGVGFFVAVALFVVLGAVVAIDRENLVLGFAVAYLATSYFAPVGETNPSVLVVLLLFEAAANFHRKRVRYLAAGLLTVELYTFLARFRNIDYVSTLPFPWWSVALQAVEFGTVCLVLIGLVYASHHSRFHPS